MGSSNRHWPSMFKSKPIYTTQKDHQWQSPHSSATNRSSPYSSGCDERAPEPKPRWNPKPEQIRILESIFNSGLVNPPRDEIRRIRARLQEYGQVGDANVFYWFQNRKSRSKHKNRHLQKTQNPQPGSKAVTITTSSSSSSDKSSSKSIEFFLNSPTVSVNQQPQPYLGGAGGNVSPAPPPATPRGVLSRTFLFPRGATETSFVTSSGMLLTDLMMNHQYGIPTKNPSSKMVEEDAIIKMFNHTTPPPPPPPPTLFVPNAPSTINDLQGVEEAVGTGKTIVFINDVPFEVPVGGFINVKEAFGGDAVLVDSSGQAVVTNECGMTVQALEHGAFYYLVRSFTYDHAATVDLI
ncbi:hypothetical protein SSX86_028305 [Deinandra increscens subsp. villosa]|uniref:Protein WUSCHEL n=1 Tax=Deinandra increscens subsp. villosa TaxID=3103831 RepID=A0AAP0CCT1_9ASTR